MTDKRKDEMPYEIWVRHAQCGKNSKGERLSAVENIPSTTRDHGRIKYTRAPIASLPEPRTEGEIKKLISDTWNDTMLAQIKAGKEINATDVILEIIRVLRDAGCLLVGS